HTYIENAPVAQIDRWSAALVGDRLVSAGTAGASSIVQTWHLTNGIQPWHLPETAAVPPLVVGPAIGAQGIPVIMGVSDDGQRAAVLSVDADGPHMGIWTVSDGR